MFDDDADIYRSLKNITAFADKLSICCDRILNKLADIDALHEAFWNDQCDHELLETLLPIFNDLHTSLNKIKSIRVKCVNISNTDGGTGVTVYEHNTRLIEAAWMIIAKIQINEKNHTSKGDSKFNKVESLQSVCKAGMKVKLVHMKEVIMNHPHRKKVMTKRSIVSMTVIVKVTNHETFVQSSKNVFFNLLTF